VTLTRARYAIYYSVGFSYEQHQQSRDRIYRAGQTRKCVYYYLAAEDSVDFVAMRCLKRKASESEGTLAALREQLEHRLPPTTPAPRNPA
jgi:SNF2 family DNA or RNA helicase